MNWIEAFELMHRLDGNGYTEVKEIDEVEKTDEVIKEQLFKDLKSSVYVAELPKGAYGKPIC